VYTITNSWGGAFQGQVVVTNTGTTATTGWTVTWSFANGQVITQLWGGRVTQSGAAVSVINETWNGSLNANATATFGFNANWNNATNAIPVLTCRRTP
jgi:cellulase/cellobiase CelA1